MIAAAEKNDPKIQVKRNKLQLECEQYVLEEEEDDDQVISVVDDQSQSSEFDDEEDSNEGSGESDRRFSLFQG